MTLIVATIMAASHLYIGWRFKTAIKPTSFRTIFKWLPFLLLLSFYLLPLSAWAYYFLWGDPDVLAWPQPLTYWFWFGLIFSFQAATGLLILDVVKLGFHLFSGWSKQKAGLIYSRAVFITMAILFAFTASKMVYDTRAIQTDDIPFESYKISESLQGFRIIHITDLQGDEYTGRAEISRYISKVNALNPDLVIFTGDLISYGTDFIDMAAEELSKVQAAHGLYAVIGDHDYWAGVPNIAAALDRYNVPLLQDENKIITIGSDSLLLTGITEVYSKHISEDSLQSLTKANFPNIRIMVSHQATEKVIRQSQEAEYDLLLGGHTHGGQLRVPFLFMTFSAAERDTEYLSGVHRFGEMLMNINNGLGFTLAPVRYNAPPNISVIDFQTK